MLAGVGVYAQVRVSSAVHDFDSHLIDGTIVGLTREEADELQRDARTWSWARNGVFAGATATLLAGLLLWFWPSDDATPSLFVNTDGTSVLVGGEY